MVAETTHSLKLTERISKVCTESGLRVAPDTNLISGQKKDGDGMLSSNSSSDEKDDVLPLYRQEPPKNRVFKRLSSESDIQSFGGQNRVDGASLLLLICIIPYSLTVKVNVRTSEDINSAVTEYWVEGGVTADAQVPLFGDSANRTVAVPLSSIVKNVIGQFETPRKCM
jgi:hypothetical protein